MSHLLHLVSSNTDVALSIFQHIGSLFQLDDAAIVCKAFNRVLNDTEQGRQIWLNLGVQITTGVDHFDEQDIRLRFAHFSTRKDFFWHLRVLVCPWHTEGVRFPVEVWDGSLEEMLLFFADPEETMLQLQMEADNRCIRMSARPPAVEGEEEFFVEDEDVEFLDPVPITHSHAELERLTVQKKVVPDFSHDRGCTYRFFPIHAGVFAVVEVFSRVFDNDQFVDHGIYYFSHISRRVLRHIKYEDFGTACQINVLSRPMELWIQDAYNIEYHGPSCACRLDDNAVMESMDEALWLAGQGDGRGAREFMEKMGVHVNCVGSISSRTMLHYAAKQGHADAVRQLLQGGYSHVDAEDDFGHTALYMACAELHLEVVEVLLQEGGADPLIGESVLSSIGDFVRYRPYSLLTDRLNDDIKRVVPAIVRLLLAKDQRVVEVSDSHFNEPCILSSPEAVRMLCATGDKPGFDHVVCTFGHFRHRIQELSAIESLCIMVREFGVDVNKVKGDCFSEQGVITLASFGIAESVIVAIDCLGADTAVKSRTGKTIREVVTERANRGPGDPEAQRTLLFLNSRGV